MKPIQQLAREGRTGTRQRVAEKPWGRGWLRKGRGKKSAAKSLCPRLASCGGLGVGWDRGSGKARGLQDL